MTARRNDQGISETATIILVFLTLVVGIWIASVVLSPAVGKGEAFKQKESANNRLFAQAYFNDTAEQIHAAQAKINAAAKVKNLTDEQTVRAEGLRSYCADLVGDYNAKSRNYTTQQFKDADLPVSFDASTDCEPTE